MIQDLSGLASRMAERLQDRLQPTQLEVIDESHHHAGHQPDMTGTGETHMRVRVISDRFTGMTRLARHRLVNELLKPELDAGLHALAVEPAAPGEATRW